MKRLRPVRLIALGFALAVLAPAVTTSAVLADARWLRVTGQGVSADLADVSLRHVLDTITREARVRIVTDTPPEMHVTVRFRDLPLEEALKRLLGSDALVFIYAPTEAGADGAPRSRLTEVRAYDGSGLRAGDLTGGNDAHHASVMFAGSEDANDGAGAANGVAGVTQPRQRADAAAGTQDDDDDAGLVAALAGALEDADPNIREAAATALGRTWSERGVEPLARTLTDEDAWVREAAARALGQLWVDQAVDLLADVVMTDPARAVREAAAEALGETADARAIPALTAALQDPAGSVRERAAEALAGLRGSDALAPLMETALRDDDPWVRQEARNAITRLAAGRRPVTSR